MRREFESRCPHQHKYMKTINLPITTVVDGREWQLFALEYYTDDGLKFSTYIYALSYYHANMVLLELKDSAKISGKISGVTKDGVQT